MAFVNYYKIGSMLTVAKLLLWALTPPNLVVPIFVKTIQNVMMKILKTFLIKLGYGQYELTERDVVSTKYEP